MPPRAAAAAARPPRRPQLRRQLRRFRPLFGARDKEARRDARMRDAWRRCGGDDKRWQGGCKDQGWLYEKGDRVLATTGPMIPMPMSEAAGGHENSVGNGHGWAILDNPPPLPPSPTTPYRKPGGPLPHPRRRWGMAADIAAQLIGGAPGTAALLRALTGFAGGAQVDTGYSGILRDFASSRHDQGCALIRCCDLAGISYEDIIGVPPSNQRGCTLFNRGMQPCRVAAILLAGCGTASAVECWANGSLPVSACHANLTGAAGLALRIVCPATEEDLRILHTGAQQGRVSS
eukprot:gene47396-7453_t